MFADATDASNGFLLHIEPISARIITIYHISVYNADNRWLPCAGGFVIANEAFTTTRVKNAPSDDARNRFIYENLENVTGFSFRCNRPEDGDEIAIRVLYQVVKK